MTVRRQDKGIAHHAPECPECGLEIGAPAEAWESVRLPEGSTTADWLICMACGYGWQTDDPEVIALAWYGLGGGDALNGVPLEREGDKDTPPVRDDRSLVLYLRQSRANSTDEGARAAYEHILRAIGAGVDDG